MSIKEPTSAKPTKIRRLISSRSEGTTMKTSIFRPITAIFISIAGCACAIAGSTTYQYDALGRISVVTEGAAVVHYYYDPAGNRTQKQTQGGTATTLTMPSSNAV